jgi:hypothetical protein
MCSIILTGCFDGKEQIGTEKETDTVNVNETDTDPMITKFAYYAVIREEGRGFSISTDENGELIVDMIDYAPHSNDRARSIPINWQEYDALVQIIEDYDLTSWDGFGLNRNSNVKALDVGGVELEIQWSDGNSVIAHSYNEVEDNFPDNIAEVDQALADYIKLIVENNTVD